MRIDDTLRVNASRLYRSPSALAGTAHASYLHSKNMQDKIAKQTKDTGWLIGHASAQQTIAHSVIHLIRKISATCKQASKSYNAAQLRGAVFASNKSFCSSFCKHVPFLFAEQLCKLDGASLLPLLATSYERLQNNAPEFHLDRAKIAWVFKFVSVLQCCIFQVRRADSLRYKLLLTSSSLKKQRS
jgi:hypothetical protein